MIIDLNEVADHEYSLIPAGTIANVVIDIIPFNGNSVTHSKTSQALYLNLKLTVTEGKYANYTIFHKVGVRGQKEDIEGNIWENMGKIELKRIMYSAHNISKGDVSEESKEKLKLNGYEGINGLKCRVAIGIDLGNETYGSKNKIDKFITPDDANYLQDKPRIDDDAEIVDDSIPFLKK